MLEFLYQVLIFPFEYALGLILKEMHRYTENYGLSIVLLSLAVNTLLLPFFILAERWQAAERIKQLGMADNLAEIKSTYKGYERHALTSTVYRQHGYNPLNSLKSVVGLLIQIPFFLAAYNLLLDRPDLSGESFLFVADLAKPDAALPTAVGSLNILPFAMTFINVMAIYVFSKGKPFKENVNQYALAFIFFIVLYTASSALLVYWTVSNIFGFFKAAFFVKVQARFSTQSPAQRESKLLDQAKGLYWLGLLLILSLPLVSAPLALLSSGSSSDFSEPLSFYLQPMLGGVIGGLFFGFIIFSILPRVLILTLGLLFTFIALSLVVNAFAFSGDYGDMSNFVFETGIETDATQVNLNYLAILLISIGLIWILLAGKSSALIKCLQAAVLAAVCLATLDTYNFFAKRKGIATQADQVEEKVFQLSKTGKNVIVMMMDRMVGGYIPSALEHVNGLEESLEGFVWYPKTLSPSNFTILGVPSIAGGYDYLPARINNLDDSVRLPVRLDESFRVLPYNFKQAGFGTSIIQPSSFFIAQNKRHLQKTKVSWLTNSHHKYWRKRNGISDTASSIHSQLAHFGLFRVAPVSVRQKIYAEGTWEPFKQSSDSKDVQARLEKQKLWKRSTYYGGIKSQRNITAIKHWSVMDDLPLLSKTDENLPDQFYYFTNELNHEPWITRPDLEIEIDGPVTFSPAYLEKFKSKYSAQHAITVAATMKHLMEWIEWLKKNDVYDNTRIIVVSDHGRNTYDPMFNNQTVKITGGGKLKSGYVGYFHSTLMVKDFDSRESYEVSDKFMTIADVPWLALKGIHDGINPYTGSKIREPSKKTPWSVAFAPWRMNEHGTFKFNVHGHFIVENEDIFDTNNWRQAPAGSELPKPMIQYADDE